MRKSATTWFLDSFRYLLIIIAGVAVLYLAWIRVHWMLSIVAAIPVFFVMFCFVYLLMLPLYFQTPENRVVSRVFKALGEVDFDKALRVLEAHEKPHSAMVRDGRTTIKIIRRLPTADLFFAPLFLLLLLLPGYETVVGRLSFLDKYAAWKYALPCLFFGLCILAIAWKIWAEWRDVKFERARYDVESILKKRGLASYERLRRMGPKYAPEFLNKLIQTYPQVFKHTTMKKKKKPAIALVS